MHYVFDTVEYNDAAVRTNIPKQNHATDIGSDNVLDRLRTVQNALKSVHHADT